jgi:DNA-directed RNA polymerase sigma subunit (sigma70/sigma32)
MSYASREFLFDDDRNPMKIGAATAIAAELSEHSDLDQIAYARDVNRAAPLTAEEEKTLGWRIINDNCTASRDWMVRANLRLVVDVIRHYTGRGMDFISLVEAGNAGLQQAVEEFDPARGARFSTHATWWIKNSIKHAISKHSLAAGLRLAPASSREDGPLLFIAHGIEPALPRS